MIIMNSNILIDELKYKLSIIKLFIIVFQILILALKIFKGIIDVAILSNLISYLFAKDVI